MSSALSRSTLLVLLGQISISNKPIVINGQIVSLSMETVRLGCDAELLRTPSDIRTSVRARIEQMFCKIFILQNKSNGKTHHMSTHLNDEDFELLTITRDRGVAFASISAPPMNVMTPSLFRELAKFGAQIAEDDSCRVVVLRSDDPDFFIAHFDVSAILNFPVEGPAERPEQLEGFHLMCETFRTMPKATIAEIGGRIGGGGSELSMSCDMALELLVER